MDNSADFKVTHMQPAEPLTATRYSTVAMTQEEVSAQLFSCVDSEKACDEVYTG